MIEQLPETDAGIIKIKVSGGLRHQDFSELLAWINAAVTKTGNCRLLFSFGDFHGWDARALWDDLKFHTTKCDHVERIAYVGNKWWEGVMVKMSTPFTNSVIRYFDAPEMEAALAWIRENGSE